MVLQYINPGERFEEIITLVKTKGSLQKLLVLQRKGRNGETNVSNEDQTDAIALVMVTNVCSSHQELPLPGGCCQAVLLPMAQASSPLCCCSSTARSQGQWTATGVPLPP